jgi:hypothetical protein
MMFVEGGNRSWTCRVDVGFKVELRKVFSRRADVDVKVSVKLLDSVVVWVYRRPRPWWSAARLSLAQQQDTHTKGGIFLKIIYMLFLSGPLFLGIRQTETQIIDMLFLSGPLFLGIRRTATQIIDMLFLSGPLILGSRRTATQIKTCYF